MARGDLLRRLLDAVDEGAILSSAFFQAVVALVDAFFELEELLVDASLFLELDDRAGKIPQLSELLQLFPLSHDRTSVGDFRIGAGRRIMFNTKEGGVGVNRRDGREK